MFMFRQRPSELGGGFASAVYIDVTRYRAPNKDVQERSTGTKVFQGLLRAGAYIRRTQK